ncbi:putative permease [Gottschalkia purinilytica]|uniref:Putative permease n=1 Tax=Gottschalkia purinilytica TaxID=1503 RepID=A0A0L0WAN2_GOTPU|nr:efflux transporter SaoE [Gottschalkia purinilytica]KNF08385.1 putative permease [Gottschalkia purinilytica]
MSIISTLENIIRSSISALNGSSFWIVISYALAGILHNVLNPEKFQKMLGNKKFSSILKSTISGMLLPICSCGVFPLGVSMYYSGAYLGPTLSFMTATPIINPAAIILSLGLLGKEITIIYLIAGFTVPIITGLLANKFAGDEICYIDGADEFDDDFDILDDEEKDSRSLREKLVEGLKWGFLDLGKSISKYIIPGMLLAGFILTIVPQHFIQEYLGNPSLISLGGIAIIAALMYVCAVGHIPFIAAIVASGASPGVAITFLMAGAATNLPELISMYKMIGKRTTTIYLSTTLIFSFMFGYLANRTLLENFIPVVNFDSSKKTIKIAKSLIINAPDSVRYLCSLIVFFLFVYAIWPKLKKLVISESV